MIETLLKLNRGVARDLLGEKRHRTISQVVGAGIDRDLGLRRGAGKTLLHGALAIGAVGGAFALYRMLAK